MLDESCIIERRRADGHQFGAFSYEMEINQNLTDEELDKLGEWLSENCRDNFIMLVDVGKIYAGGTSNNSLAWKNRRHRQLDEIKKIRIRLSRWDENLFKLVWKP